MAAGLPCIANDTPSNREVLTEGAMGALVPVGDVKNLVDAMRRFVTDGACAHSVAWAGFDRVEACYGIASLASRYVDLYRALSRATSRG